MAYIHKDFCKYCEAETYHLNHRCNTCADRLHREKIAIWNSKTNEEKIQELLKRIEALENQNIKYA